MTNIIAELRLIMKDIHITDYINMIAGLTLIIKDVYMRLYYHGDINHTNIS